MTRGAPTFVRLALALATLATGAVGTADTPTFIIFKYQHQVGHETDSCTEAPGGVACHAHFQLDFTGASIALDADLRTTAAFEPVSYAAHGQNSTRSFLDLNVTISDGHASIRDNGVERRAAVPGVFFVLQQDVPFGAQEVLLSYWRAHGEPERIPLLPAGEVRIRRRAAIVLSGSHEHLTRYSVHGVTWGDETVWLNGQGKIAAVVGSDAEEDRIEAVRLPYEPALHDLVTQAAADAAADLEAAATAVKPIAAGSFALRHATVIDLADDRDPMSDATIVVRNGRIDRLTSGVDPAPAGMNTIDASGTFVLPGLWDTHAHFEQWEWGPAYLASGVTSVRDVGNEIEFVVPIRRVLNAGRGPGPRLYAAGLIDSDPGSLTSEHAEDAAAARSIVRRYHDLGFEEIKIYQSLRPALIPIVTAEAHRLGMQVTGHVPTGADALGATANGMDQITHVGFITRVMRRSGETEVHADSPPATAAVRALLDRHTIVEPTLARSEFNLHPRNRPFSDTEPTVAWLPPELAVILDHAGVAADREAQSARSFAAALETTRILHRAGIPLLAGSDLVVPGASVHRELELLVRAGLTPREALRAATATAAAVLGDRETGVVAPGRRADLVVLDANPLVDISNVRRVRWTVAQGRLYDPSALWHLVDIKPTPWPAAPFRPAP